VKCSVRFFALVFGLAFALSASAQIYQWKDKDGRTHFSDQPPPTQPGVQVHKHEQTPLSETEPDETPAETTGSGQGGLEPKNAASVSALKKSEAQQRDEAFRKRRAEAAEAQEKAQRDAARAAQREQNCQRARSQYGALSSGQRIVRFTESGERRFLSDEERAAEIARLQELIETLCEKG